MASQIAHLPHMTKGVAMHEEGEGTGANVISISTLRWTSCPTMRESRYSPHTVQELCSPEHHIAWQPPNI